MKNCNGNKVTKAIIELFDVAIIDEYFSGVDFETANRGKSVAKCLSLYLKNSQKKSKYDTLRTSVAC